MCRGSSTRPTVAATFSVSQHHPFYAARLWATLDHLTDGRAGWNVVTSINHNQDANFGVDRPPTDVRYDRAHEFIEVCRKLWSSWEDYINVGKQFMAKSPNAVTRWRISSE